MLLDWLIRFRWRLTLYALSPGVLSLCLLVFGWPTGGVIGGLAWTYGFIAFNLGQADFREAYIWMEDESDEEDDAQS